MLVNSTLANCPGFGVHLSTAGDANGDGFSDVIVGAWAQNSFTGKAYLYLGGVSGLSSSASWTALGEAAGDQFGFSGASVGDVNGDGYSDVVFSAKGHNSDTGKVYLYLGEASGLSAIAMWTGLGEVAGDEFGISLTSAGDVNGDGYADLLVGNYGISAPGKAYLYRGSSSGLEVSSSWTASGEANSDLFGLSLSTAGDVNGDGYSDVVIGAQNYNTGQGKAYVYMGSDTGLSVSSSWTTLGEGSNDWFGASVSVAGDVNGDSFADVIIGAVNKDTGTGKTYLYLGGQSGLASTTSWTATGETTNSAFGRKGAAGDVNGDGFADVLVGAPGIVSNTGKTYLYLGSAAGLSSADSWNTPGETLANNFAASVASAGDVNGDGFSDVVVGAYRQNSYTGKAYLYLGDGAGLAVSPAWTSLGEAINDQFGFSVASAGDVNGDGYADVMVGAPRHNGSTGKSYLFLGGIAGLSGSSSWFALGENSGDSFGYRVASAGDVNGDGYSDVVVGALAFNSYSGKGYLYQGSSSGLSASPEWALAGEATGDRFGFSIGTGGDVNGDGYSDLVVGAIGYNTFRGKVTAYLGGASGLSASSSWIRTGLTSQRVGYSIATVGDINGDGYSDVVVGAIGHLNYTGKAWLYRGSSAGLSVGASWTGLGEAEGDRFGCAALSAGDVNGDGYTDLLVGAYGNASYTGKAYLYLASAAGLSGSPSWTAVGESGGDRFGWALAGAGDTDGDGFSEVIVGAYLNSSSTGKAYLYQGNDNPGLPLRFSQQRGDFSAPIAPLGLAHNQEARIGLLLHSPFGRALAKLEWQVVPFHGNFKVLQNPIQSLDRWWDTGITGISRGELVDLSEFQGPWIWRVRARYNPANHLFSPHGPWFSVPGRGPLETALRSTIVDAPPPCVTPDEETYISAVTLDGNGKPVLHYQDPNQPSEVTGYNIYRSDSPTGPWILLGSNVVDMDAGTANNQYVDQTGDVGGPWFYEIAAWNGSCAAEGPY